MHTNCPPSGGRNVLGLYQTQQHSPDPEGKTAALGVRPHQWTERKKKVIPCSTGAL